MRFRKKPVVIEAFMIGLHQEPNWFIGSPFVKAIYKDHCNAYEIHTLEGVMTAGFGDWIIKGVKDEIYPCKPDIFEMTYEAAEKHEEKLRADHQATLEECVSLADYVALEKERDSALAELVKLKACQNNNV